jgi:hypothetical protein
LDSHIQTPTNHTNNTPPETTKTTRPLVGGVLRTSHSDSQDQERFVGS